MLKSTDFYTVLHNWYSLAMASKPTSATYRYADAIVKYLSEQDYKSCFYEDYNMTIVVEESKGLPVEYYLPDNKLIFRNIKQYDYETIIALTAIELEFQNEWSDYIKSLFAYAPIVDSGLLNIKKSNPELAKTLPDFDEVLWTTDISDYKITTGGLNNFMRKYQRFFESSKDVYLKISRIMVMASKIKQYKFKSDEYLL